MAKFNYTLPSGSKFVLNAPAGTTQAQADIIFYTQVAAGSLVGYSVGDTLSSASTKLTSFQLSREERGTAGVPDSTILAIISGAPIIAPVPTLANVPITSPITGADFALINKDSLGQPSIGPLEPEQVQALMAQVINLVDQPADEVSNDKGIGQYGLNVPQLEQAGYVKPGTYDAYLANNPENLVSVLSGPEVWTGYNGVTSLSEVLSDPRLQNQIQTEIMQNSYNSLTSAGVIQSSNPPPVSLSNGQVYNDNAKGLIGASALTVLGIYQSGSLTGLGNIVVSAFSSNTANTVIGGLSTNSLSAANNLFGGTLASLGLGSISSALGGFSTLGSTSITSIGTEGTASGLTTTIAGDIGALVNNSSIFGTGLTAAWAQGSNLSSLANSVYSTSANAISTGYEKIAGSISGLQTSFNSLTSSGLANISLSGLGDKLTGGVGTLASGALGSLTPIVQGSLGALTAQAKNALGPLAGNMDIIGSMSQYSVNFSGFSSDSLVSSVQAAPGYVNTVARPTVNNAVSRIIGNPKVPSPIYGLNSTTSTQADIQAAQTALQQLSGAVSQLKGEVTRVVTNATGTATTSLFG